MFILYSSKKNLKDESALFDSLSIFAEYHVIIYSWFSLLYNYRLKNKISSIFTDSSSNYFLFMHKDLSGLPYTQIKYNFWCGHMCLQF